MAPSTATPILAMVLVALVPKVVTEEMITRKIRAQIRLYSIAVAPRRSWA